MGFSRGWGADPLPPISRSLHGLHVIRVLPFFLGNERTVIDFNSPDHVGKLCHPDGMTIDEEDKLWVAIIANGKIARIDPLTGMLISYLAQFVCLFELVQQF